MNLIGTGYIIIINEFMIYEKKKETEKKIINWKQEICYVCRVVT